MKTRVYLPLSPTDLVALSADQPLAAGRTAYAVTDALRSREPSLGDEEELEAHVAGIAAVAGAQAGWGAVVAAVDLAETQIDRDGEPDAPAALVRLPAELAVGQIVAFYVGDDVLGDMSEDDAQGEITLSWYDVSELDEVSRLVGGA